MTSPVTRRDFASQVGGAVAGAVTATVLSSPASAAMLQDKPAKPADPDPPAGGMTFEDHQLAVLRELHPAPHLTEEMLQGIREGLRHNRALAERIRQAPLTHDVAPAFQFVVPRS